MTLRLPLRVLALRLVLRRKFSSFSCIGRCLIVTASYLDAAAFVKAKINNSGVLALGKNYKLIIIICR